MEKVSVKNISFLCVGALLFAGVATGAYYGINYATALAGKKETVCGVIDSSKCYIGFLPTHDGADSYLSGYLADDGERSDEFEFDFSNSSNSVPGLSKEYLWADFGAFIKSCDPSSRGTDLTDLSNWRISLNDKADCSTIPFSFLGNWGVYAVGFGSLASDGDKGSFPAVYSFAFYPTCAGEGSSSL